MIPDHTDIDWVADGLPRVDDCELDGPDLARRDLLAHIAAAGEPVTARARSTRRRRTPRRRRVLQTGLVAAGAAAGALVAVNVGTTGHGDVPEASAAQIIANASTMSAPAGDQVLAYTIVDADGTTEQTAENGGDPQQWAIRYSTADGHLEYADGQEGNMREFYDPSTNTIYQDAPGSRVVGLSPDDDALVGEMNAPGARTTVDTTATTADGRPATEVTSTESDGNVYSLWVDPTVHDRPLQFTWTLPSGQMRTTVFRDYETVTPGAGTLSPARLTDAYPSATVTKLDDAAFIAAKKRAGVK